MANLLQSIAKNVRCGDASKVAELVQKASDSGLSWGVILDEGLFSGMQVVGNLFKEEEIYLPEVIMAAKAMEAGQKVIEPLMGNASAGKKRGTVVLGTVKGDIHNLGKNLVGIMLRGAGFEVIDLGVDVSTEIFVEATISNKAQITAMSALLTTTMPHMRTTIEALWTAGLKGKVKTMIGGACVTQEYADEIGADGYSENAGAAVKKVKELIGLN